MASHTEPAPETEKTAKKQSLGVQQASRDPRSSGTPSGSNSRNPPSEIQPNAPGPGTSRAPQGRYVKDSSRTAIQPTPETKHATNTATTTSPSPPSDSSSALSSLAAHFSSLHHRPNNQPLIVTNIWDAATAQLAAAHPSSSALATASYAIAASCGVADDSLTLSQNLSALDRGIVAAARAAGKPLTVDLQSGYGDWLREAVRELVRRGVVGVNLEDRDTITGRLYSVEEAAERVREVIAVAAGEDREAAGGGAGGSVIKGFVVNARTDVLLTEGGTLDQAIERGKRYLEAGATTVFVWGGPKRGGLKRQELERAVRELGGRVSVKLSLGQGSLTVRELTDIGVARISCGPELWRKAMKAFEEGVQLILGASK